MVQQLPLLSSLSITGVITLLSVQPAWADVNQITAVTVNPTKDGIEVILQTTNPKLSRVVTSTYEKTYIAELTNTQLRLQSGKPFSVSNPTSGITSVTVTPLNGNSVRVVVTGVDSPPAVRVEQSNGSLVLTVAAPSQTSASTEPQQPTATEEEPDIELTVTANRRVTPLSETPATVDIKTQEELEREEPLPRTVGEQLQTLPGIVINRLGLLSGSANIRGLTGERIGVLVDGERLPNLEFGPDLGSVDPFRVERLEVLKGPASSIYGADAFGGVINIITTTPRPDAPFGVRAFAFGGGFAEYGGNLEITGPNFVIGTSRKVAGDAKDADGDLIPPQGTEYKVFDIYGTGRIDLSSRDRLELRFDRYRQDNADLNGFPSPPFIEAKNVFRERDRYSLAYVNEGVEGGTNFSVRGYYQRSFRRFENTTQVTVSAPPTFRPVTITTPSSTNTLTESYGFIGIANTPLGELATLTYGVEISQDNTSSLNRITDRSGPLGTRTFYGAFVQSTYNVFDNLTLAGGVRYDIFETEENTGRENDNDAVTFNVGSIYRFTENVTARVNFAQGFRPPSLLYLFGSESDRTFFAPSRGRVVSDPDLEPERANNFDIGLEYASEQVRVGLTYFRNQVSNFQGFDNIVPAPPPNRFGPPAATIKVANKDVLLQGVEFKVGYAFTRSLSLEGNLTYVNSEDESGAPLSQLEVFPLTALLRLVYDDRRFSGYLQSRIYGGQGNVLLENNRLGGGSPGSTVFDLSVGYKLTPTTQVAVSVENLFNAEYVYPTVNFPAPGIRVLGSLRAEF